MASHLKETDLKASSAAIQSFQKIIYPFVGASTLALIFAAFSNFERTLFNYHIGFTFIVSIAVGGLFLAMLQQVTNSGWSIVIRRVPEMFSHLIPFGFILVIPMFLGLNTLFEWSRPEALAHDPLLMHKKTYLNDTFFILRTLFYFSVWTFLYKKVVRQSIAQDHKGTAALTQNIAKWSAIGMVLFGFTITFAATDWIMSLKAQWFSTIYGVYYFSGIFVAVLAFTIIVIYALQSVGYLHVINKEHFHDLGKLLYAMNVFWAYIAFSQYMLIWYGNIPEETVFFADRLKSNWPDISLLLIIGHFIIPFFMLMSRHAKRNTFILLFSAIWLLGMHYVDLYWLILPNFTKDFAPLGWIEITVFVWALSICFLPVLYGLKKHDLIAHKDPRIQESLEFHQL